MTDSVREIIAGGIQQHAYPRGLPGTEEYVWGDWHRETNLGFADAIIQVLADAGYVILHKPSVTYNPVTFTGLAGEPYDYREVMRMYEPVAAAQEGDSNG